MFVLPNPMEANVKSCPPEVEGVMVVVPEPDLAPLVKPPTVMID